MKTQQANEITNSTRPSILDFSHIRMTYITHFYLNQRDVSSVMDLLSRYSRFSSYVLDRLQFIIVDDGSPLEYTVPSFNLNLKWLKIIEDIPWNQPGARNLGVVYAKSDKILLTDIDHEFPESTIRHMINRKECGQNAYKVFREGKKTRPHPNIFLMSRARYLRLFGYDEEFSGHYGADDYRFVKFQKYHGTRFLKLNKKYRCRLRDDIDYTRSYHSLERDLSYNTPVDARKKEEITNYGPEAGHSRIFLNFRWKIIEDYSRGKKLHQKKRPLWKNLWYWRWLFGYK